MCARRGGFTIIELLVVIGIMLAVTAMTIPLLAPSREDRRVTEATRIVSSMFAGARARAIEIGRPVGVTLERDTNDTSRCLTLTYAEVPPRYAGGFVNSRIIIEGEPSSGDTDMSGTIDAGEFTDWNGDGIYQTGGFITNITDGGTAADTSWLGLIRPGDSLKVNYQGFEYTIGLPNISAGNVDANGYINALSSSAPWELATIRGGHGLSAGVATEAFSAPKSPLYEDSTTTPNAGRFDLGSDSGGLPFQITRQAYRSAAQTQTLPETMCIDLFASNTAADLIPLLAYAGDVTIMYGPGGSIDSVRRGGDVTVPSGPLFLLVGKTALVGGNVAPKPGEPIYNWQDLDARWLMINHQSGLLASNPTSTVDTTAAVDVQITQSRAIAREGIKVGDK